MARYKDAVPALPKILKCPDCRRSFGKLRDLNDHIKKTDHNKGQPLGKQALLVAVGLQKSLIFEAPRVQAWPRHSSRLSK